MAFAGRVGRQRHLPAAHEVKTECGRALCENGLPRLEIHVFRETAEPLDGRSRQACKQGVVRQLGQSGKAQFYLPLIFAGAIARANGCYFFRYVYACGAPGGAPAAPDAPRSAELFPPPGELVGGPLPVT